jgi:diaminopimelate epimerase
MDFYKFHGTGNDFILVDDRDRQFNRTTAQIAALCHRRFGIGADGLMLLQLADGYDFRMVYYNADGNESSMCGNGGRCITAFARLLGIISARTCFLAVDGPHSAVINADDSISLDMQDVATIERKEGYTVLNTGSPHYVYPVADVHSVDVFSEGRRIRNLGQFMPAGINVNFVQPDGTNRLFVRTYERGVEDETLSCGTGVTAAAIASTGTATGFFAINITTPGGTLKVTFTKPSADAATGVVLTGPAAFVYRGSIPQ